MTAHEVVAELLGAYALDAVDGDEAAAVEEHLAECPRCRAEVARHREVVALLGNAGGVAPAGVWERIAAELSLETGAVPGAVGGTGRLSRLERPDLAASGRGRLRGRPPAAVLALGAIAAALAAVAGVLSARVGDLDGQVGNLDRQVAQVTAALSKSSVGAAALAASLDPRNPRIELGPASSSVSPPSAQLIVDRASGTAFFVARSLHPLRGGRTYQLWSLVRGEPVSVGLLGSSPSSSEPAQVLVASNMSTFMVTAEPEGGTPRPTTPVLIEGTLPAAS